MKLVQPLFEGAVDIVGDVHGEAGALFGLLDRLGYDGHGNHPEGRRLVFVGDLVDRGPDSIAVLQHVRTLVQSNKAQCIVGNHELNVLLNARKHGNHWWFGEVETIRRDKAAPSFQRLLVDGALRREFAAFLLSLPLVLEREGLCVVHAAWHKPSVDALRNLDMNVVEAHEHFRAQVAASVRDDMDKDDVALAFQNNNPVKRLTSGPEQRVEERFFAGGQWRSVGRHRWWDTHSGTPRVVIGHYWRETERDPNLSPDLASFRASGDNMFEGTHFAQQVNNVMCVDYSVGVRYEERGKGLREGALGTNLAALRLPDNVLVFDNGKAVGVRD